MSLPGLTILLIDFSDSIGFSESPALSTVPELIVWAKLANSVVASIITGPSSLTNGPILSAAISDPPPVAAAIAHLVAI
ncbi:hypothetical protein SDC9_117962 [bioreactor metagenome]|uniref:Uncharacterized protein n=1 Tax=bioreactor metagenome TaxID=1076179 RepID=A0A645C067_9ZZZZ